MENMDAVELNMKTEENVDENNQTNKDCIKVKQEKSHQKASVNKIKLVAVHDNGESFSEKELTQMILDNIEISSDGTASCKICWKSFKGVPKTSNKSAKFHVETHIEGVSYTCQICPKTYRYKKLLHFISLKIIIFQDQKFTLST